MLQNMTSGSLEGFGGEASRVELWVMCVIGEISSVCVNSENNIFYLFMYVTNYACSWSLQTTKTPSHLKIDMLLHCGNRSTNRNLQAEHAVDINVTL